MYNIPKENTNFSIFSLEPEKIFSFHDDFFLGKSGQKFLETTVLETQVFNPKNTEKFQ